MVDHLQPAGAYDAYRLGKMLSRWGWPAEGAVMLERSLATAFNDADEAALRAMAMWRATRLPALSRGDLEASLRRQTRHALADAYVKSDHADRAQPIVEALAAEAGPGVPLSLAQLAGRTQAATGQRVIEGRIKKAETENQNDPNYWQRRARYFEGRSEWDQAESAYRRAVELTPDRDVDRLVHGVDRSQTIGRLENFLDRRQRGDEAAALLWHEFEAAELTSPYANQMLVDLKNLRSVTAPPLTADRPRLWAWLDIEDAWDHAQEAVLKSMARAAYPPEGGDPGSLNDVLDRATSLVSDHHPSRAAIVGDLLSDHDQYERAIPLLEDATARLKGLMEQRSATTRLMDCYLELGRIDDVMALQPARLKDLSPSYAAEYLIRLIEAAEKHDATAAANKWTRDLHNLGQRYKIRP